MADGKGVHKIAAEGKIKEAFRDEDIKLKCLEIVMAHGTDNLKATPWNTAQRYFAWIKYGNPDIQVL
jgi:hypothetical protein